VLHNSTHFSCCRSCCLLISIRNETIDYDRWIIVLSNGVLLMLPIKLGGLQLDN
jgi:hypothetical protein